MPNHVTNKIRAPSHVIKGMLNAEGNIDFNAIVPFTGPNNFDGISLAAEDAAEIVCGIPTDAHPLIAELQRQNRRNVNIATLRADDFAQFVGMLENFRACGFLHSMDFARKTWGTKWNAYDQSVDADAGTAQFDSAWACPVPALKVLSAKFPDDEIHITFADEDTGSNCGTFTLKAGVEIASDIAPAWSLQSADERIKWTAFAREVKGWTGEDEDEDGIANG